MCATSPCLVRGIVDLLGLDSTFNAFWPYTNAASLAQNGGVCTNAGTHFHCECVSVANTCYAGPTCADPDPCIQPTPQPEPALGPAPEPVVEPAGCDEQQLEHTTRACPALAQGRVCALRCEDGYHRDGVAMCRGDGTVSGGSCISGTPHAALTVHVPAFANNLCVSNCRRRSRYTCRCSSTKHVDSGVNVRGRVQRNYGW